MTHIFDTLYLAWIKEYKRMNIKKKYFKIAFVAIAYVIWLIIFFGIRELLLLKNIEYRLWLSSLGYFISVVTPFVLLGMTIKVLFDFLLYKYSSEQTLGRVIKAAKVIVFAIYAIISCGLLFLIALFGIFTMHEERIDEYGTLEVMYGGFPTESYWYSYEKVSFWGRKPAYGLNNIKMLEEKYGCKFTLDTSGLDIGYVRYVPDTYPDLLVAVYGGQELRDNFAEQYINSVCVQVYNELDLVSERGNKQFEGSTYHFCLLADWENGKRLAEDSAKLISHVLTAISQDVNAPCESGFLYVVANHQDNSQHSVAIPFGNPAEYYDTSAEYIYEELEYQITAYDMLKAESDNLSSVPSTEEPQEVVEYIWEDEIKELAYCIYKEELSDREDYFEMTYNAKGNPYAILGSDESTYRTLVYDRQSKNGKCELFVYYEEHLNGIGNSLENTMIVNMYAINKETREIYVSGKQAWADVGSPEYREATGE